MDSNTFFEYVPSDGIRLFTVAMLPSREGAYPTVVIRCPYVDWLETWTEKDICDLYEKENESWLKRGYAVVYQHCRGRGKSDGDCIPYINEGKDTNALYDWIREQSFYNGELYLKGGSYLTSVHYCAAPYGKDVKGASFGIQDSERYNICYRNGVLKKKLHTDWYIGMYKAKSKMKKNYSADSLDMLPLKDLSKSVFGERVPDLDKMLASPKISDPFWQTHEGGADARGAADNVDFPVLFTTGFYDIYTGGIFDMWRSMSKKTRENSALVVSPYDHGDRYNEGINVALSFPKGRRDEEFGLDYEIDWFDSIRNGTEPGFKKGQITYYRLFENKWATDTFDCQREMKIPLGKGALTYAYDPQNPPGFKGGLCCNFGGAMFQDKPYLRDDIITVYSDKFPEDVFVKGKMKARLKVSSDCYDTCFYMRVSIEKEQGDFGLRDDITTLCHQLGDYIPNTPVDLEFTFDEHAFLIKKDERLRIDISSADTENYVRHTNTKGLYSEQTETRIAYNTVYLSESALTLPIENKNM